MFCRGFQGRGQLPGHGFASLGSKLYFGFQVSRLSPATVSAFLPSMPARHFCDAAARYARRAAFFYALLAGKGRRAIFGAAPPSTPGRPPLDKSPNPYYTCIIRIRTLEDTALPDPRPLIRRLSIAINLIDGDYTRTARRLGLKENELSLFYALDDGAPHSQAEISRHWLIPKTTLNTIVGDCVARGLIRLEGGREKYIRLTEAGAAFARRALDAVYALEDAAFARTLSRFSPEFVAALADFAQELNAETARFLTEPPQKP